MRKTILVLKEGSIPVRAISLYMKCSLSTVRRWIKRGSPMDDLSDLIGRGRPAIYAEETLMRIVAFYCQSRPLPGCGRWTLRWAALYLKANPEQIGATPSKSTIHRILSNNSLKPHQSRYFLHITDPDFFPKMEHLVGLYNNAPGFLFFFDECPGIQILKRLTPDVRTQETKKRLEEFEYIRNGTMDVFAFLDYATGKVSSECHGNHTAATYVEVFRRHVSRFPAQEPLNYVMDNLSTHNGYPFCRVVAELSQVKCPTENDLDTRAKRVEWLRSETKRIVIHFTPYHGSWLNLVEIWFGIMGGKLQRESFSSPEAFKAAYDAFLENWNTLLAHPFRWTYEGKGLHERAIKRFTDMLRHSAKEMELRTLTNGIMLMTNLLDKYFREVSMESWGRLIETVLSARATLSEIIEREDGPKRKKNAEKAMAAFLTMLNQRLDQKIAA